MNRIKLMMLLAGSILIVQGCEPEQSDQSMVQEMTNAYETDGIYESPSEQVASTFEYESEQSQPVMQPEQFSQPLQSQQDTPTNATEPASPAATAQTFQESGKAFVVYSAREAQDNHFVPSGWMGDYGDIKINEQITDNCPSRDGCVQFVYNAQGSQGQGWAGVYWQHPANNWGDQNGGYNLDEMDQLTFLARGETGNELIEKILVGGITGPYPDSDTIEAGPIKLSKEWQQYRIDLTGKDLSYINGGFGWVTSLSTNPQGCTIYLDNIQFEAQDRQTNRKLINSVHWRVLTKK